MELLTQKRGKPAVADGAQQVKKKAKVENKDPNAPKKPVNAYVMFFQHKRHSVQEQYFKVTASTDFFSETFCMFTFVHLSPGKWFSLAYHTYYASVKSVCIYSVVSVRLESWWCYNQTDRYGVVASRHCVRVGSCPSTTRRMFNLKAVLARQCYRLY